MICVSTLFFLDFIISIFLHKWFIHTLLVYCVITQFSFRVPVITKQSFYGILFFLVLQDCFIYGRFGLLFIFLIPLMLVARSLQKRLFVHDSLIFPFFLISCLLFFDVFFVKKWLFCKEISILTTFLKFFINLGIGYIILLGVRSNRFIFTGVKIKEESLDSKQEGCLIRDFILK